MMIIIITRIINNGIPIPRANARLLLLSSSYSSSPLSSSSSSSSAVNPSAATFDFVREIPPTYVPSTKAPFRVSYESSAVEFSGTVRAASKSTDPSLMDKIVSNFNLPLN
jgi:hypothetical protein